MVVKKYSKVRVSNPGEDHIVPLHPGQGFCVIVERDCEIEVQSSFFVKTSTVYEGDTVTFNFEQVFDLSLWSRISKVYLGEVILLCKHGISNLCVILDSSNKNKSPLFTVINPNKNYVKVDACGMVNVVIYDFGSNASCEATTYPSGLGLAVEQIEYRRLDTSNFSFNWKEVDNFYFAYPRSTIFNDLSSVKEHHFWFRCDYLTMTNVAQKEAGVYNGGRIIFDLGQKEYVLHINLVVRSKQKRKLFELNTPKNTVIETETFQLKPMEIKKQVKQPNVLFKKIVSFKKKDDTEFNSHKVIYM